MRCPRCHEPMTDEGADREPRMITCPCDTIWMWPGEAPNPGPCDHVGVVEDGPERLVIHARAHPGALAAVALLASGTLMPGLVALIIPELDLLAKLVVGVPFVAGGVAIGAVGWAWVTNRRVTTVTPRGISVVHEPYTFLPLDDREFVAGDIDALFVAYPFEGERGWRYPTHLYVRAKGRESVLAWHVPPELGLYLVGRAEAVLGITRPA